MKNGPPDLKIAKSAKRKEGRRKRRSIFLDPKEK
jgi:hypothetical protein